MEAWIGIIGTVVGALLAGGAAWLNSRFQHSRQTERERNRLILGKLEDLFETVSEVESSYTALTTAQMVRAFSPETKEVSDINYVPRSKLRMLVSFYAPEVGPLLDRLLTHIDELGTMIAKHIVQPGGPDGDVKKELGLIMVKHKGLERLCQEFQAEISKLSQKYM